MTSRPNSLLRFRTIAWLWCLIVVGCGGQPGSQSDGGGTGTDLIRPTIINKFPADGQESLPVNTVIAITFSEPISVRRLDRVDAEITLFQANSGTLQPVQKTSQWEAASNTLFVRPSTLLEPDRHYTVRITSNIGDLSANPLDTGTSDGILIWRFTTGDTFDGEKPVWNPNRTVRAFPDRYDRIVVCWWNDDPPQTVTTCDSAIDGFSPAAYDPPTNASNGLIYNVQYKRSVDTEFTNAASGVGANRIVLADLVASTRYEIQVRVSDVAANQADEIVVADSVTTPQAGRLYVANQVVNRLSVIPDVGQATGDRASTLVTADQTRLYAPVGIAVDSDGGFMYVADTSQNMIAAYRLDQLGVYGSGHNREPEWTIQGTLTRTDITGLCGPSSLRLERPPGINKVYLYVTNSLVMATGYPPGLCLPDNILVFDVTEPPQSSNQAPYAVVRNANEFRTPLAFAVDETHGLVYVANRDNAMFADLGGSRVLVFSFTRDSVDRTIKLSPSPIRTFWGSEGVPCISAAGPVRDRICGPTAAAYIPETDTEADKLIVVNREKSNMLIFSNVSAPTTFDQQSPVVVEGDKTGLTGARPTHVFVDSSNNRVYITTDLGQSVLIFDKDDLFVGGNVPPLRVIKGTKTLLGQPAVDATVQSRGPFGVFVVPAESPNPADEAYVATPGIFGAAGLTPIANVAIFDVSTSRDPVAAPTDPLSKRVTNTPPARVLVNPMTWPGGMALDLHPQDAQNSPSQRLYVASYHANMILVYDNPGDFVSGVKAPDRIIAGPLTQLDHPVALLFRRDSYESGALYVVNQSSHSVIVFEEGDGTPANPLLAGDRAPDRYIGAPEGANPLTEPFTSANATQMVAPSGLAVDPARDILYVSNRDAESYQDARGRRIVAFQDASTIGPYNPSAGISASNNIAPTWKLQGDPPPTCSTCGPVTDKTTLLRPAGLLVIPDPTPSDASADDQLVVANQGNATLLIFHGVSDFVAAAEDPGRPDPLFNQYPTWRIYDDSLLSLADYLAGPFGLAFDAITRQLYASDRTTNRVSAFDLSLLPAANANGTIKDVATVTIKPRVIAGQSTGLLQPLGVALDPQN
jgi:DNA-binding beta-propeller fold protein YncE